MVIRQERRKRLSQRSHQKRLLRYTIRIQAFVRGCLCRQRVRTTVSSPILRVELQRREVLLNSASTQIQAIARGYLCRRRLQRRMRYQSELLTGSDSSCYHQTAHNNSSYDHHNKSSESYFTPEILSRYPSSDTLSSLLYVPPRANNLIKIFQASPLAYLDANREPRRVPRIDLHFERETITKVLKGSNVSVDFEIATDDRFGAFLAKDECRAIHFSCHGHPTYLAFEDGWGAMQFLEASVLKRWIACGGSQLEFVFVSACDSWSIGKAFAEAGVPHVVCCDKQTTLLDSGAAVKFTKALYQALAWGKTLQKAFDLACQELSVYPCYESQQFCLLPENSNHNVPIFSRDLPGSAPTRSTDDSPDLPSPTDFFVRDDLEMYRTIQAIKNTRVVRVKGPAGIGKSTLVMECCRYLSDRQEVVNVDDIHWKSVNPDKEESMKPDFLATCFRMLLPQWLNGSSTTPVIRECRRNIIHHYKERRSLLVIEAKTLSRRGIKKMHSFLKRLIEGTNHLKLVVIYGSHVDPDNIGDLSMAFDITVDSLNIESTVKLFARYCEHVPNRVYPRVCDCGDLWRLLSPKGPTPGNLSKRHSAILRMLGGSNPKSVCLVASKISADNYLTLAELGLYEDLDLFQTQAELLLLEFEFNRRIAFRRAREDSDGRLLLERKLKAIHCLMTEFQDARKLKSALELKYVEVLQSENESRETWFSLQTELDKVQALIKKEEDAIVSWLINSRTSLFSARIRNEQVEVDEKLVYNTGSPRQDSGPSSVALDLQVSVDVLKSNHGIKACLKLLREKRNELAVDQLYDKADSIVIHLRLLQELSHLKSSTSELEALSCQLAAAMQNFAESLDYERAKSANKMLDKVNGTIRKELKAKTRGPPTLSFRRGVIKIAYPTSVVTEQCSPPPLYSSLVEKQRKRRKEVIGLVDQMLANLRMATGNDGDEDSRMNDSFTTFMTEPMSISSLDTS